MRVLRRLLVGWGVNVAALATATAASGGVNIVSDEGSRLVMLILTGLVFSLVNAIVKPLVQLIALPVIVLTLGVALFFINIFMLYLTSWIVDDFEIESFGAAIVGTLVIWAVNVILYGVFDVQDWRERRRAPGPGKQQ